MYICEKGMRVRARRLFSTTEDCLEIYEKETE